MLALSGAKREKLLADVNAFLTGKIWRFHVASRAVGAMAGSAYRDNRWGLSGLCLGTILTDMQADQDHCNCYMTGPLTS